MRSAGSERAYEPSQEAMKTQPSQEAMKMQVDPDTLDYQEKFERYESGAAFRNSTGSASYKERRIGALSVCALRPPQEDDDVPAPVCYVAT